MNLVKTIENHNASCDRNPVSQLNPKGIVIPNEAHVCQEDVFVKRKQKDESERSKDKKVQEMIEEESDEP